MNKLKQATLISAATLTIGAVGIGTQAVNAQSSGSTSTSSSTNHETRFQAMNDKLASYLADKFNLNTDEVKTALSDFRNQLDDERNQLKYDKLAQLKEDGKLSEAQYDRIVGDLQAIDELRSQLRDATDSDQRSELKKSIKQKVAALRDYVKGEDLSMRSLGVNLYGEAHGHWKLKHGDRHMEGEVQAGSRSSR